MTTNLFIAGFQKCGTDTLYGLLAQHPEVIASQPKEPHFFSQDPAQRDATAYETCFAAGAGVRLDASASYAVIEHAAGAIHDSTSGNARIVFMVRPYAERIWSAFQHMRKSEPRFDNRDFDEAVVWQPADLSTAISSEEAGLSLACERGTVATEPFREFGDEVLWNYRYLENTRYAHHIDRFSALFGPEAVMVVTLGELADHPGKVLEAVCRFASLSPPPATIDLGLRRNTTRVPSKNVIGRLLANRGLRSAIRAIMPQDLHRKAKSALEGVALDHPDPMPDEIRCALDALFEADRASLNQCMQRGGIGSL